MNNYFFKKLTRRLYRYIHYYHKCNINQIKRYVEYDSLIFIIKSLILYHIIIVDFILTLLKTTKEINTIIFINFLKKLFLFLIKTSSQRKIKSKSF